MERTTVIVTDNSLTFYSVVRKEEDDWTNNLLNQFEAIELFNGRPLPPKPITAIIYL